MFEKIKDNNNLVRLITILLIASILIISLSILTENSDTRRQIIDRDGAAEKELCSVLSSIKGAGEVDVLVQYNEDSSVSGVIVTSEGANDPIIMNNLTKGVATLYNIPVSSVIVFEKEQGE
mgnify:CR=1 FL=1